MVIPHFTYFKPCGWAQTPWQESRKTTVTIGCQFTFQMLTSIYKTVCTKYLQSILFKAQGCLQLSNGFKSEWVTQVTQNSQLVYADSPSEQEDQQFQRMLRKPSFASKVKAHSHNLIYLPHKPLPGSTPIILKDTNWISKLIYCLLHLYAMFSLQPH